MSKTTSNFFTEKNLEFFCFKLSFIELSHAKKNGLTFHYTGWLIGILIMAYYNPYITGARIFIAQLGLFDVWFLWKNEKIQVRKLMKPARNFQLCHSWCSKIASVLFAADGMTWQCFEEPWNWWRVVGTGPFGYQILGPKRAVFGGFWGGAQISHPFLEDSGGNAFIKLHGNRKPL